MTDGLVNNAGKFRSKGVGVFLGNQLIHAGAKADFVPALISELLEWANESDAHPLIRVTKGLGFLRYLLLRNY